MKPSRLHADWLASAHFSVFHRYDHTIFIPETSDDCIRSRGPTRIFCMYEFLAIFHGVEQSFDRLNNFIIGSSACSRSLSEGTDYSHQATDRLTDRASAGYPTKLTPRAGCHGSRGALLSLDIPNYHLPRPCSRRHTHGHRDPPEERSQGEGRETPCSPSRSRELFLRTMSNNQFILINSRN